MVTAMMAGAAANIPFAHAAQIAQIAVTAAPPFTATDRMCIVPHARAAVRTHASMPRMLIATTAAAAVNMLSVFREQTASTAEAAASAMSTAHIATLCIDTIHSNTLTLRIGITPQPCTSMPPGAWAAMARTTPTRARVTSEAPTCAMVSASMAASYARASLQ